MKPITQRMKKITVIYYVDDEHHVEDRLCELREELKTVQENSEVGLVYYDHKITSE